MIFIFIFITTLTFDLVTLLCSEMTEEEMMDLALRLSEQEASITALRLQKEEEAMMKAIHESVSTESVASERKHKQVQLCC